jgi:hypothetical protein
VLCCQGTNQRVQKGSEGSKVQRVQGVARSTLIRPGVLTVRGAAEAPLPDEVVEDNLTSRGSQPEQPGSLRQVQREARHFPVRTDDERFQVPARRLTGNRIALT